MTTATAVTGRYPFASDFIVAVDDFWGQNGTLRTADPATQVAACPACKSKSRTEEHKRYPLVVRGGGEGVWRLARSCGCSEDSIAAALGEAAAASADIDGARLLEEIKTFIERYMVLPSAETADLLAVWTLHTHALAVAYATPYLRITSATKECGKTVLMEILSTLTARGWHAVNPSAAVLYRKIDRQRPTLLLDEMDNFPIDDRRDALAVLNAGYKRGATIDRCKENGDLESFSAFCAKAYAGIDEKRLVDTLLSRSITIRLEKRLASDNIEPWIGQDCEEEAVLLRDRAAAWAEQHADQLNQRPELPEVIINRAAEVWRPLVANRAGLRKIRFHDLRHCFGSAAITKLDPYAVQSYMGHQHYSTTARYLHHKPRPQDAAALHEAFGGDVSPDMSPTTPVPDELSATEQG